MTFTLDTTYHGPATIILSYTLGEILATATNDLFLSTYENTITLPTDPFTGAVTVTKPKVVVAGKLKTGTITLAGKGGIPKHGVGGVLAIITATGPRHHQGQPGRRRGWSAGAHRHHRSLGAADQEVARHAQHHDGRLVGRAPRATRAT